MARSDDRLNLDRKYINQSQIVLTQSESEIELTEYLIQSDGNGISQDSVPEVDFAPLLSQSAGSLGFNSTGYGVRFIVLCVSADTKDAAASPRSL
jgi:hypothetical protein